MPHGYYKRALSALNGITLLGGLGSVPLGVCKPVPRPRTGQVAYSKLFYRGYFWF